MPSVWPVASSRSAALVTCTWGRHDYGEDVVQYREEGKSFEGGEGNEMVDQLGSIYSQPLM